MEMATHFPTRSRRTMGFAVAVAGSLLASAVLAAPGSALTTTKTKTFKPVHKTRHALLFAPRGVSAEDVRRARVRILKRRHHRSRTRRISADKVRRAVESGSRVRVRKAPRAHGKLKVSLDLGESICAFGSFMHLNPPGACWRPYSAQSPFNHGVPPGARQVSQSAQIVARTVGFGAGGPMFTGGIADTNADYDHPIYYSRASDPLYTLDCTESWGTCEIEGMRVRIPDAARAAGGADAHLAVIDQAGGWEYDLYDVSAKPDGGGNLRFAWGGRTAIAGPGADGLGSEATAAHFGLAAGVIRPEELEAGQIDHALFMAVKCTNGSYVWPAPGAGSRTCSSMGLSNANAPALGQHFFLDLSNAEIDALTISPWQRTVLRAAARYGMFVGDTGADYLGWTIFVESGSSYTSFGLDDPWVKLAQDYGIASWSQGGRDVYTFDLSDAVDWGGKLRVADPCVSRQTC
jgi:hypothetical protein